MSMTSSAPADSSTRPSTPPSVADGVAGHDHVVQFYETDEFLTQVVAEFMGDGLGAGEPIVVIATDAHREAFCARLSELGVDVQGAAATGRLTLLDAQETLATFMVDGMPDREQFQTSVGGTLAGVAAQQGGQRRVRAYGEMVDLLWRDGNRTAALLLEELWNELARTQSFSLLCAYVVGRFYKAGAHDLHDVCSAHSHVRIPERSNAELENAMRTATLARQYAQTLAAELEHRKDVERALRGALSEREALVAKLQETVRANELFTAILGHDLRNPLNAIVTAAQLGLRQAHDPVRSARCSNRILASGLRMARMIDQILDFTRLRLQQGLPISRAATELVSTVQQVIDELQVANPDRRIALERVGDTNGSWDADRVAQVFSNLVGNAVLHGDATHDVRVRVDGTAPDVVRVEVWNSGTIGPDLLTRLFVPFDAEKRRKSPQGLGLGLYISREVVIAHGGSVDVASSDAAGTSFVVTLPRT
jgi:signal transduction histidine kinase